MRPVLLLLGLVAAVSASDPVKIHLYYETLCPYSIDFVVNQLYKTWTLVKDIMEVEMFPFGNAEYYPDGDGWSFKCQHGSDECRGNMIHACAKDHFKDINIEMEFVNCLLSADYPPNAGAKCAAQVGQDWTPLEECVNSVTGQNLLHEVALQQENLHPKLYFVPWIIVDDEFSEEQVGACQTNLLKVVCDKYTGASRPAACDTSELTSSKIGVSKL
ncbi:gamma-interferon-inducible lysosomal thiol reductase-like [Portunus trituberculatus]|uniref:gamma-interferon-inducible lysosomal thiol reductase-like n=1 Tax=Portunus trituberculatus TaxID=210409 RepID=UPI001E1CBA45|nr:gamma-interferon-inducible lysosomal thiol reductase-like [Portunus trituberculatus]